jgi:hypothetical protein
MGKMVPTIGDVVIYHLDESDVQAIVDEEGKNSNPVNPGQMVPAVVVNALGNETVNLKAQIDGNTSDLWITSACKGKGLREWCWKHEVE